MKVCISMLEYLFPVVENKESVLLLSVVVLHRRHTRLDSISKKKKTISLVHVVHVTIIITYLNSRHKRNNKINCANTHKKKISRNQALLFFAHEVPESLGTRLSMQHCKVIKRTGL